MSESKLPKQCVNCDLSEYETPLLSLQFQDKTIWICPQCLPTLIHHPERVADKLMDTRQQPILPEPEVDE